MFSPYKPPTSEFTGESLNGRALRWRAALNFSALPTVWVVATQIDELYRFGWRGNLYPDLSLFNQAFVFLPLVMLLAATGFMSARRCAEKSVGAAILLGCAFGLSWVMAILLEALAISLWFYTFHPVAGKIGVAALGLSIVFIPYGVAVCVFTRW